MVSRIGTGLLTSSCPGLLTVVSRIGTVLLSSSRPGLLAVGVSRVGTEPTTLGVSPSGSGGGGGDRLDDVGHSLSLLPFTGVVFRLTSTLVRCSSRTSSSSSCSLNVCKAIVYSASVSSRRGERACTRRDSWLCHWSLV